MTDFPLIVTEAAQARIAALLAAEFVDGQALIVGVRPGGCSGYSYEMFFDTTVAPNAVTSSFAPDDAEPFTVAMDPSSAVLLAGATLDYHTGLMSEGFHITNPNAQRTCGCGQSFS